MHTTLKTRFRFSMWLCTFTILFFLFHFEMLLPYNIHFSSSVALAQDHNSDLDTQIATPVSFEVNDFTGAGHLSYPIVVPPARDGLAPNLSLSYTSMGSNSWVGTGWDLSAGFIQRRGVRKGAPKYNDTDVFELQLSSGSPQELVSIGSGEYRLKIEGAFLKIIFYSAGNYWEVWDKSGVKMKFGSAASSRIGKVRDPGGSDKDKTYRWFLDRVEDPKTNYTEIIYYRDQDPTNTYQVYLQEIRYNGQVSGGLAHNHRILFNLESANRPDPIYNYRGGFKMWTQKRLSSIEVKTNDALVRKYQLQYKEPFSDVAGYNGRSLLSQITPYGNDGATSLPPVKFSYLAIDNRPAPDNTNRGFGGATSWPNPSAWGVADGNFIRNNYFIYNRCHVYNYGTYTDVLDMNGDGLPDRVVFDKTSPYNTWTVYPNNGNGFNNVTQPNWPNPSVWNNDDFINGNLIRNIQTTGTGTYTDLIDMNGDGLPDRVKFDGSKWLVYLNNGTGFDQANLNGWPNATGNIRTITFYNDLPLRYTLTTTDVIDMNGDGLPDRVVFDEMSMKWLVSLNNGAGFDAAVEWPGGCICFIRSTFNINNGDVNYTYTDLIDMNGDGLPDQVVYYVTPPYNTWVVYFNNGHGFDANGVNWPVSGSSYIRQTDLNGTSFDLIDMNGDGLPDRVEYGNSTWRVYLNTGSGFGPGIDWPTPGGNYIRNNSFNRFTDNCDQNYYTITFFYGNYTDVIDMNGDGLPDRVVYSGSCSPPYTNCPWSVYLNKGPVSDLLSKVENGIGGTIQFTYAPSTLYTNHYLPFVVQTVKSVSFNDGNGLISTINHSYGGGYYHPNEREFRGFEYVKQTKPNMTTVETWYYQDKKDDPFDNQCPGCRGQPYEQQIKDSSGNLYLLTNYFYTPTSPYPGLTFPGLTRKDDLVYDGTSTSKRSAVSFEYDLYGNIKRTYYHGDVDPTSGEEIPGDEKDENTEYLCVNDATQYVCRPSHKFTKDSSGAIKSQTWYTYYTKNSLITKDLLTKEEWLNGGTNPVTSYGYDTYGNQTSITDPKNNMTTIEYDTVTHTYPTKATIPYLNFYIEKTYDYGFGAVLTEKGYNGNVTSYTYDTFGRKQTIVKPPDVSPTEVYSYENFGIVGSQKVKVLLRKDSASQTWKETYFDGLGRTCLTKREGPLPGKAICTATGYNNRGLVSGRSRPYFEDSQIIYWTTYQYDVVGRQTKITPPDGKFTTIGYDKRRTSTIDANKHAKVQEKDPYGRLIKVEEYAGIGTPESPYSLYATTTYQYDVLNNLVKVTDAVGNQTTMVYDTLSRKIRMTDPDMCSSQDPNICYWAYEYDPNGNLKAQTDAKSQRIVLSYYNLAIGRDDPLNRIMRKEYPNGSYVAYTYDQGAPAGNPKGRLTSVADASGTVQYFYDERGRTKKTIKTVDGQPYAVDTAYDSLDRIVSITYPDQEIVYNTYDAAGNLSGISGAANYATYSNYTPLGQPGIIQYGNTVSTAYAYDDFTNRLTQILTSRGQTLQNLSYQYDDVGNVKMIADGLDSTRTQQFQYDHLNRLIKADSQSYPYNLQTVTYQYNGQYGGPHPHAATQAGPDSYTYDNNGNMLTGAGRTIAYDYDNRPSSISLNGVTGFVYDYQGMRVKKTGSSTTIYIGDLYECIGGSCVKHILAGSKIVVSKIASATYYYHTDHLGSRTSSRM